MSKQRREEKRLAKAITENFTSTTCPPAFEDRIYDIRQERDKQHAKEERRNTLIIYTDGAYKDEHGEKSGAWAHIVARRKGKILEPIDGDGNRENRVITKGAQPELSAIIEAMQTAFVKYPHRNLCLRTDQEELASIAMRYLKSHKDAALGEEKRRNMRKHYIHHREKNDLELEYDRIFDLLDEAAKRPYSFSMEYRRSRSDRCSRIVDGLAVNLNNGNDIDIPHYLAQLMLEDEGNLRHHGARGDRVL